MLFAAVAVGSAFSLLPLPLVIYSPGPTYDVLGDQGGQPILEVQGGSSDAAGQLRMVTISELGGPGSSVTAPSLLQALFSPGYSVKRYSQVYPRGMTAEDLKTISASQMTSSHSTASVAALEYLGYELPTTITVMGIADGSDAAGKIQEGDKLISIEVPGAGIYPMNTPSAPFALLRTVPPGTELRVAVERGGEELTKSVTTMADPEGDRTESGSKLGIVLDLDIDMPVEIVFHLEKVGGPSAGMIFALGIIDELSDSDLTGGHTIAGTGAIHYDGTIEPIGGVQQKMYGALRDGAEWFLVPSSNCDSVVGNVPDGLKVAAVGTIGEAVSTAQQIAAGDADALTTCEAVLASDG